ncbi:MAG: DUF58 domain-containing protein [Acidimicrobiia bacterium]
MAVVLVADLLLPRRALRRISVERRFTPRAFLGEHVDVDLRIRNHSRLPVPWLEVHEPVSFELGGESPRWGLSLGSRQEVHLGYEARARRRGYYLLGPLTVTTGGVLGLAGDSSSTYQPDHLIVYPRIVPIERLGLPTRSPFALLEEPTALLEDPARLRGVRAYLAGDPRRKIHWKATAHLSDLVVKQLEPATARDTTLFLDLDRDNYAHTRHWSGPELGITTAASLATHIVNREGLAVGLVCTGFDPLDEGQVEVVIPPRSGSSHLMRVLEILARIQSTREPGFSELIRRSEHQLPWGATLGVITGALTSELANTMANLRAQGFMVCLLLIQHDAETEAETFDMALRGVVRHVRYERDLESV